MNIMLVILFLLLPGQVVEADNLPNMPFDQFVESNQKRKNVDTHLFQDDTVGDLKKQRQDNQKKNYQQLFINKSYRYQPKKALFKKPANISSTATTQKTTTKESHYGRWLVGFVILGSVISMIIWWKGRFNDA